VNRVSLLERLDAQLASAGERDDTLGVMIIRLQRMREFRLIHGYAASDMLAEAASRRVEGALRPVDWVTRLTEHEFVAMLPGLRDSQHALLAAARVVRMFEESLDLGELHVPASVAVGVAVSPEHGSSAAMLMRRAELALRSAEHTADRCALYASSAERALVPYEWLHEALASNRLDVYLQPILDLRSGATVGVESLARWNDPARGPIAPDVFIRLAEESGLIAELTRWSLNNTLRLCAPLQAKPGSPGVSINLSPRVFGQRDLVTQITGALNIWNVPPTAVTLEVTENALMEDPDVSLRLLQRLRDEGLRISIDDFGAGYSSLAYLKHFPATELKIDRSFVADLQRDPRSMQVVRSIIDLGHHLGLTVVAEGVEDGITLNMLRGMGCDFAQGYHIGRPAPADQVIAALANQATR